MIFGNCANLLFSLLVVNCAIAKINAIFFDEIFEYLLDGIDDSDSSSSSSEEELTNSNLNVTCKNCTLTVECANCTHTDNIIQSTTPMKLEYSQQIAEVTSSKPTPTIPAPERVVEIMTNNIPKQDIATASENIVTMASTQNPDGQKPEKTNKDEEKLPPLTSSADSASESKDQDKVMENSNSSSDTDSNSSDDQSKITTKK